MSAAVAEVVELLGQLTTGGAIQRGRAAVQAAHIVGRLTGEQKRQLAVDVAERVAPHLVPRIEAETGADLTPAQVSALLDMFKRMDADQVAELSRAVRERDTSSAAIREVMGGAMAVAGIASRPDEAAPVEGGDAEGAALGGASTDAEQAAQAEVDAEAARSAAIAQANAEREAAMARAEADRDAALAEAESTARRAVEEARRNAARAAAALGGAAGGLASRLRPRSDAPADPVPEDLEDHAFRDLDLEWDFHLATPTPGLLRSDGLAGSGGARGASSPPSGVVGVVAAEPDGFRRRRAAQAAIREGRVAHGDAVALCRLFDRVGDRTWVAGDLVERGLLDLADLQVLLPPRTAQRLAARPGRTA